MAAAHRGSCLNQAPEACVSEALLLFSSPKCETTCFLSLVGSASSNIPGKETVTKRGACFHSSCLPTTTRQAKGRAGMEPKSQPLAPPSWKPAAFEEDRWPAPDRTHTSSPRYRVKGHQQEESVLGGSAATPVLSTSGRMGPRGSSSAHKLPGPWASTILEWPMALVPAYSKACVSSPSDCLRRKGWHLDS